MTEIAAAVATIGGKSAHGAKGHGAHKGGELDFAAMVASLGQPSGEGADADITGSTDDVTAMGEPGESVIVDLALGAAAQSAVVDTVVAAQGATVMPSVPTARVIPDRPAKRGETVALDVGSRGAVPHRTPTGDVPPALSMPMPTSAPMPLRPGSVPATSIPSNIANAGTPSTAPDIVPVSSQAGPAAPTVVVDDTISGRASVADSDQAPAVPAQAVAAAVQVPEEVASDIPLPTAPANDDGAAAKPRIIPVGVQTGAALRQAAREAAHSVATDAAATPVPLSPLPQGARPPLLPATATSVNVPVAREPASVPSTRTAIVEGEAVAATVTGAPVMSALHRAVTARADVGAAPAQESGTMSDISPWRAQPGQDPSAGQDKGSDKGREGAASAPLAQDPQAAVTADDGSASARQFADILQSLPPIAQSRLSVVGDTSPIVTGPADVGATLQGQVIDMGVNGQWIDRMAQEITTLAQGSGHSRFQLNPPNLGRIQIDVWHGENGGQVQLLTETDEAAHRLREGRSGLEADARMAALSIGSITIERSQSGFDSGADQASQQQPQQQQGSQRNPQQGGDQSPAQNGAQTGAQGDGRGQQAGAQANAQTSPQGNGQSQQNSRGEGKSPLNRDVLGERAGTVAPDSATLRRDGDRLVRYA